METALWRLRRLQAHHHHQQQQQKCPLVLLFVLGVDGRDNDLSAAVVRWLLAVDEISEAMEETVLLVGPDALAIFYHPDAHDALLPLLTVPIPKTEYVGDEDVEANEALKWRAFRAMTTEDMVPKGFRVGITLPRGQDDAVEEVEYWPLVQSFAHEHSFFSQTYDVVDATRSVSAALASLDPPALADAIKRATVSIRHHVDELAMIIAAHNNNNNTSDEKDALETACADVLRSARDYDDDDDEEEDGGKKNNKGRPPFARVAEDRLVFETHEPTSGIRACRTYLLRSTREAETYAKLVEAFHAGCPRVLRQHALVLRQREPACEEVSRAMERVVLGARCLVEVVAPDVVYARATIEDAVSVGDTFVVVPAATDARSKKILVQGEAGLLTGDHCAPYYFCASCPPLVRKDPISRREALGPRLDSVPCRVALLFERGSLGCGVFGNRLQVHEGGLVVSEKLEVSFLAGDATDARVVAHAGAYAIVLFLAPRAAERLGSSSCPLETNKQTVAVVVRARSEAERALRSALGPWRDHIRKSSSSSSSSVPAADESVVVVDSAADDVRRLVEALWAPSSIDKLISDYAKVDRARLLDELWPAKRPNPPATNPVDAYALVGPPGSGVDEVAAAIVRREREDDGTRWVRARAVIDQRGSLDVDATAKLLAEVDRRGARVLVTACCRDQALGLLAAMDRARTLKIRACAAVVSAFELGRGWPPALWDHCVPGLATAVVVVDSTRRVATANLARRLRAAGIAATIVGVGRGNTLGYASSVVDALLAAGFDDLAPRRQLLLADRCLADAGLAPRSSGGAWVKVDFDLEHALLVKALDELLPGAALVSRATPLEPTTDRDDATSFVAAFSRRKAWSRSDIAKRLESWDVDIAAWRREHGNGTTAALNALVRVATGGDRSRTAVGLDGNRDVVSLWPDATRGDTYVLAQGTLTPRGLADLLEMCGVDKPRKPRTREHITESELAKIEASVPLPPGWAFDGRAYVDAFGARSAVRPDLDDLVEAWLLKENNTTP